MLMNNHPAAAQAGFHCEFQCLVQHKNNQRRQNLEIEIFFIVFSSEVSDHS